MDTSVQKPCSRSDPLTATLFASASDLKAQSVELAHQALSIAWIRGNLGNHMNLIQSFLWKINN